MLQRPRLQRPRRLGAVVLSIGTVCAVTACGSSAKSGSGSTGTVPSGRGTPVGLKLTSSERSCLKKQGVTIPTGGGFRGAGPGSGKFPKGKFKQGTVPGGGNGTPPAGFAGQIAKRRSAFKACGVTLPAGGGQGAPPSAAG